MKSITLLLSVCALLLISCNNEKEIVIVNSSNPKYDLGTWIEDAKNAFYTYSDINSLWPEKVGKMQKDSLKRTNFKAFTVSKDSVVLSEFLKRNYCDNAPRLYVFDKEINLNPYLHGISCEYIRFLTPDSYNDLIFYTLDIVGKGSDNKMYSQPLTLMISLNTKECKVVGMSYYIDNPNSPNIAIYDGKYFGILDFYLDSHEYIVKYYDKKGNYVGWSPSIGLEYTQTGEKVIYTSPLKNINKGWNFTYGNDKYGRPISMRRGLERYDVQYSSSGYHITGYNDRGQKKYDFEPYDPNDFFDLRTWNRTFKSNGKLIRYDTRQTSIVKNNEKYVAEYTTTGYRLKGYDDKGRIKFEYENNYDSNFDLEYWDLKIPKRGKLIEYSYSSSGVLDTKKYYNESQSYYLREIQLSDGRFSCRGIYENSGEFIDDVLIDVSYGLFSDDEIYRNDPKTGIKTKIAEVPSKQLKNWMLNYLYKLN